MNKSISRQSLYLISLSVFLLLFVFVFSFSVLIPNGKEYREQRTELRKVNRELRKYQDFNYDTKERLEKLQKDNRKIITAFDNKFNSDRFEKQYKEFFNSLYLTQVKKTAMEDKVFVEYEVSTTSQISSPASFYKFLDAINKSDWIVGVDFPINFKRDNDIIHSSFTMKVYSANKESNSSE